MTVSFHSTQEQAQPIVHSAPPAPTPQPRLRFAPLALPATSLPLVRDSICSSVLSHHEPCNDLPATSQELPPALHALQVPTLQHQRAIAPYAHLATTHQEVNCGMKFFLLVTVHTPYDDIPMDLAGATVCTPCAAGTYSTAPTDTCIACYAGTYSLNGKIMPCFIFTFYGVQCLISLFLIAGSITCFACSPGKFSDVDRASICTRCSPGFYNQVAQLSYCLQCSPGTYTDPARRACFTLNMTFPYNLSLTLNSSVLNTGTRRRKGIFSSDYGISNGLRLAGPYSSSTATAKRTTTAIPKTTTASSQLLSTTCTVSGVVNGYATCTDTTASCCGTKSSSIRRDINADSRCSDFEINRVDNSVVGLVVTVYMLLDVTGYVNIALLQKNNPAVLSAAAPVQRGIFVCGAPTSCNASDPTQILYCDSNFTTKCCEHDSTFNIDTGSCVQNRNLCTAGTVYGSVGTYTACFLCTPGAYSNATGATSCSSCKAGSFSRDVGATACIDCPAGYFCTPYSQTQCNYSLYCPGLASPPILCPEGYFCSTPAQISKCNSSQCCPEASIGTQNCSSLGAQVASVMATRLGLPADHVAQWKVGIILTPDQACLPAKERNIVVRILILNILASTATAVADVGIASSSIDLGQITCSAGHSRRANVGSEAVGTFQILIAFQVRQAQLLHCI